MGKKEKSEFPEVPDALPEDFPELPGPAGASGPVHNPYSDAEKEYREKEEAYAKFREACMNEKTGCFGNYCDIMQQFSRSTYVKRCAKCRDSAQCFMVTQCRLMAYFYKDNKKGDDWQGE